MTTSQDLRCLCIRASSDYSLLQPATSSAWEATWVFAIAKAQLAMLSDTACWSCTLCSAFGDPTFNDQDNLHDCENGLRLGSDEQ